jgi:hypothetical protein
MQKIEKSADYTDYADFGLGSCPAFQPKRPRSQAGSFLNQAELIGGQSVDPAANRLLTNFLLFIADY